MPTYQYVARNPQGRQMTGVVDAANQSQAVRQLRGEGLVATSIQQGSVSAAARRQAKGKMGRVRLEDLVILSRQFAVMIRAGLPLIEVLNILGDQSEKISMKNVLGQIEKDVEAGASLTEAMLKHPRVFSTFFVSMVKAGEAAGMLESILDQVATYLEKLASIQRKIKAAVMYPVAVGSFALLITIFLLAVVVPVFIEIFEGLEGELPALTKGVIFASNLVRKQYLITGAVIIGTVIALLQWNKTRAGKLTIDRWKLRLPVFGPLLLKVGISKFTRTLSTLIRSGVNILSALEIVAATAGNTVIEEAILETRASIQGGESITKPLVDSGIFPPMVTRMIDVGERTGALENMLAKIADFYEDQVDATVEGLTSLIEPMLIVFLGVLVGIIVISMFMPLFTMIQHIK